MKKIIVGALVASTLISGQVLAAGSNATGMDNEIQARLMEQVLNSIETASVDLNIGDITIQSDGDGPAKVQTNDVSLTGMIGFGSDWTLDLVVPKAGGQPVNEQMLKVFPKLKAGAADLNLNIDLKMNAETARVNATFYSGYDKKTKKWLPRPLILKVTNQLNKNLLTIRIQSLRAEKHVNARNPKIQDIVGTCESDKILFDPISGQNKQVPVDCRFSGTLSEDGGYKISFTYATK